MCGIGGVFNWNGQEPSRGRLLEMSTAMESRGPDDEGIFIGSGVGLVHKRLSIIDLSDAARNPMSSEKDDIQIVQNGEIYNFRDIRRFLESRGHKFKTHCDTEVIIHGYEEWGTSVVCHLEGMFAFALYDRTKGRLLLARDRMGQKPLFVYKDSNSVVFASTLPAILSYLPHLPEVDFQAVDCFFCHVFIPGPHTVWKGIASFPPAHVATIDSERGFSQWKYWDLKAQLPQKCTEQEAFEIAEKSLSESVAKQLVADVPVGGFLSGGVDSSVVMALAARHHTNIRTFSIGFSEEEYSELRYARSVASAIGSDHSEFIVTEDDLLEILPELVWNYGQPFADSSAVPTFLLSKYTRQAVKVALSGDGGDEAFGGYWRAAAGWYSKQYSRVLPKIVRKSLVPHFLDIFDHTRLSALSRRLRSLNVLSLGNLGTGFTNSLSWYNHRTNLYTPEFINEIESASLSNGHNPISCRVGKIIEGNNPSYLQKILYDDYKTQLSDCYLVKVDVASMAASLEVRSPFLHHPFIEDVWSLPDSMKVHYGQRKWLLKRIAEKYIPREVIYRKKMGFAPPIAIWMRGRLGRLLESIIVNGYCVKSGWIRKQFFLELLKAHRSGQARHDVRLWSVLWLELWARLFLEKSLKKSDSLKNAF